MAIKYNNGKVRLWKSENVDSPAIGIKFNRNDKAGISQIYQAIQCLLLLKYGKPKR